MAASDGCMSAMTAGSTGAWPSSSSVGAASTPPAGRGSSVRHARAAALAHPNVVAVYDAGETDDELYLVTELVDGPSLADRLAATGPLPIDEGVRVAADVLAALDVAHRAGIVHRDVKPGNVLLTSTGDAKLADFGIAQRLEQETAGLTRTGDVVGTPRYLAPEQVAGGPVTAAADLYATGVVLYELLAGVPPYDAPTPLATALAHRDAPVPDLTVARARRPATDRHGRRPGDGQVAGRSAPVCGRHAGRAAGGARCRATPRTGGCHPGDA